MPEKSEKRGEWGDEGAAPDLSTFPPSTHEEWRAEAERTLKGAPFEKKLVKKTPEGLEQQPIYDASALDGLPHLGSLPGFPPFARGASHTGRAVAPWLVCQEIASASPEALGAALRYDLERGQTAVYLTLDRAGRRGLDPDRADPVDVGAGGTAVSSLADLSAALGGVALDEVPVSASAGASALPLVAMIAALARERGAGAASGLSGAIGPDPLGTLASEGWLPGSMSGWYDQMESLARWAMESAPGLRTAIVDARAYHEAGASAVEEVGFALATGVEYLRELTGRGLAPDEAASRIRFELSVGSRFFVEIAKLRAARVAWSQVVAAFGGSPEGQRLEVHASTSMWNRTVRDPHVNMLRTTTEVFSAAVGGADSIHAGPFDDAIGEPGEISRRIARNAQVLLREESRLGRVADPAGGSWYVEWLTDGIARRAWDLLREVEGMGGMARALAEGLPQRRVAEIASARAAAVASRRAVLIGTNRYANPDEGPLRRRADVPGEATAESAARAAERRAAVDAGERDAAIEALLIAARSPGAAVVEAAIAAASAGATLGEIAGALHGGGEGVSAEPLARVRGAEAYEGLVARAEEIGGRWETRPAVFLANMGPIPQHKARADFTAELFRAGGFEVLSNDGFPTPEEAAAAAVESGAPIAAICSTDDTYPELVPRFVEALRRERPDVAVVLAGYPKDQVEAHREAGVDEFVHLGVDAVSLLSSLIERCGGGS